MKFALARILYLIALAGLAAMNACAGTFSVDPVRIELSPARPHIVLQVTNLADETATIQTRVVNWSVRQNEDYYWQTNDILVNPPIFVLGPHEKQFIRLGLRRPNEDSIETAYRVILEEVPQPPRPGFSGLQTVLRISIPIFCRPRVPVAPQLAWRVEKAAGGLRLTAVNQGSAHVQVKSLEISAPLAGARVSRSMLDYVLPNQARTWLLDAAHLPPGTLRLRAVTDAGEIHETLVSETR